MIAILLSHTTQQCKSKLTLFDSTDRGLECHQIYKDRKQEGLQSPRGKVGMLECKCVSGTEPQRSQIWLQNVHVAASHTCGSCLLRKGNMAKENTGDML